MKKYSLINLPLSGLVALAMAMPNAAVAAKDKDSGGGRGNVNPAPARPAPAPSRPSTPPPAPRQAPPVQRETPRTPQREAPRAPAPAPRPSTPPPSAQREAPRAPQREAPRAPAQSPSQAEKKQTAPAPAPSRPTPQPVQKDNAKPTQPAQKQEPARPTQQQDRGQVNRPAPQAPAPQKHVPEKINPAQSSAAHNKQYKDYFDKSKPVTRTATKDGGHVEQQGNRQVRFDAKGKPVGATETTRGADGRFNGHVKYDAKGNKMAESRVLHTSDGLKLRTTTDYKRGVRVNETIVGSGHNRYVQRTVVRNNVTVINNYNVRSYYGRPYYSYRSGFAAGFFTGLMVGAIAANVYYGYAWHPYNYAWPYYSPYYTPVIGYCWGWCWAPRPYYVSAWDWTGDYIAYSYYRQVQSEIAEARREAAQAGAAAAEAQAAAAEAKAAAAEAQAAAAEIQRQVTIQARQQVEHVNKTGESRPLVTEAGDGVLNDMNYIFFVDEAKSVTAEQTGEPCDLSHGTTMKLARPQSSLPADQQATVYFKVHTSRGGDCRAGTVVAMPLDDAQDFVNEFNSRVEQGVKNAPKNVQVKR